MLNESAAITAPTSNNTLNHVLPAQLTPYGIFTMVIGVVAFILNGLLLIAMIRNASKIFTSNGSYLVANVALADLVTGFISSLWGIKTILPILGIVETVHFSLFWASIEASFLTIFVMSLERYVAIVHPFKADLWLSKTRTIQSCVLVWLFSAICGVFVAFYTSVATFCLMILFEATVLVTTFFYYKIFVKLGQRRACLPAQASDHDIHVNTDLQREYQLTTVVVVLTLILIVTVLPYMIGGQIVLATRLFSSVRYPNLDVFLHYYLPVELMNFVLNPIVYAWRLPKYRYAFLGTLQCR